MKRYVTLVLVMLLAFGCVFGVGSKAESAGVPVPKSNTVYWCAQNMVNEFSVGMATFFEQRGKEFGWKTIVLDSNTDISTQINHVETAIAAGAAAIFIDPVSTDGLNEILLTAVGEGIPVITIHGYASCQEQLTAYVACDMTRGGELQMEQCAADLGGKGRIALIRATEGHSVANMITDGYYNVLKDYPDIEVVYLGTGNWGADSATPLAETWLTADPNLDAIICNNDGMALGVRPVIESMGLEDRVKLYGLDAISEARAYLRAGGCFVASIMMDTNTEFLRGFEILKKYYDGEEFEKEVILAPVIITAANIDEYYPND